MIKHTIIFLMLFILFQQNMYTQTAPQDINLPDLGVRFTIPQGWTGEQLEDRIILGHNSIPGIMVLLSNEAESLEQLKQQASQPIIDDGLYLELTEIITTVSEKQIEGYYIGQYNGTSVKAFGIGLFNALGNGVSILIATETGVFSEAHNIEAIKIAQSMHFYKIENTETLQFWKNRIIGKKLKYMYTSSDSDYTGGSSGISDVTIINLCTDGNFTFYANSHASFDTNAGFGHVNSNQNTNGAYRIHEYGEKTLLTLTFKSGKVNEYELSLNSKKNTLLNGSRYFITQIEGCE